MYFAISAQTLDKQRHRSYIMVVEHPCGYALTHKICEILHSLICAATLNNSVLRYARKETKESHKEEYKPLYLLSSD